MPSLTFWIALGCWVTVSATLYVRVLYVIKTTKHEMYDTFFFRQFFSQGLFDMAFFAVYVAFNTLPPSVNLTLNGTLLIRVQYLHTYYFLYAQFCEDLPQMLVFFIQLVVPFFLMVHCLFQPEPYYTLDESGTTMRVNAPESVIINATEAALTTAIACVVCALSYALLLRKWLAYSKSVKAQSSARDKYFQRQTALTLMGFILFIALCVVTAFYVTILVGVWLYPTTYRWIVSFYPEIVAALSFMNPWALIVTNANTRKRVFLITAQSTMVYTTSVF